MRVILVVGLSAALSAALTGCSGRALPMMDASAQVDTGPAAPPPDDLPATVNDASIEPLRLSARIDQRIPRLGMLVAAGWWSSVGVTLDELDSSETVDVEISELLHVQLANLAGDPNAIGLTLRPGAICFAKVACVLLDYEWMTAAPKGLQAEHIAHELGHALGLHDLADPLAVMHSTPHAADGLTAADIAEFHRARGN